jgi:DNA primase large subunit
MLAARPVARLDNKRRAVLDPRKRQFAKSQWQEQSYEHAMNFYNVPPTGDIALEQFEEWGIARLKGTALFYINCPHADILSHSPCRT